MSLLITDSDGECLYKTASIDEAEVNKIIADAFSRENENGAFSVGDKSVLLRSVSLYGRRLRFFMDFDSLARRYGDVTTLCVDSLFASLTEPSAQPKRILVGTLMRVVSKSAKRLIKSDATIKTVIPKGDMTVIASPPALITCLVLMILQFSSTCDSISVGAAADGESTAFYVRGDRPCKRVPLIFTFLYQLSLANGFSLELFGEDSLSEIMLSSRVADASAFGFKTASENDILKVAELLTEIFGE